MINPEDITDPTTAMNMALALMAKAFKLNYSTPTNSNQRISSNPRNRQIAQPGMNMGQERQMQIIRGCSESKSSECWKSEWANWCSRTWKSESDWEWGVGHFARDCTVRPRRKDAAYLHTQLLIAQKEETTDNAPIYDSDGSAEVHENCDNNEMFNMFTQEEQYTELLEPIPEPQHIPQNDNNVISKVTDVEQEGETVEQHYIGNGNLMATRAEGNAAGQNGNQMRCYNCKGVGHYAGSYTARQRRRDAAYLQTQLLIAQKEEAGIQLQAEEYDLMATAAIDSAPVYDTDGSAENLAIEVEKVNSVNRKLKETNEDMNTELARFKNQERCFEISQEKYDKLERCYQQSVYQEQCLSKKINALHLISEETLQLAQESRDKMKQMNKEIKPANYTKINHLSGVFVPQKALTREELYFLNNSKTANVSKSFLIPNEDLSDDTTPSVARKFLNEDAAKFVGDFKSLANEADASLAKHKALELEIERLLKAVVSQDIVSVVQNASVVDTSIERLQAQLGDLKGKSKDTSCVSDTRNLLSQKLKNKNVELEFQVLNYARENAHLKATYKNLFDSISVSRAQTKTIIASLQNELQSNIYKNTKLGTQLFKKGSDQKDNTQDTSKNTKFAKQPIVKNLPKVGKTNALSKPVTSNSVSTPQESKGVNNDKVIAPGMFKINPSKTSRDEKQVPTTVSASARKKPITVSQPHVITKKNVNSDLNGLSSTGIENTKTRRPHPRSNIKNDRVPSVFKSSRSKNKEAEDVKSKVVCAMCKKCLISVNHDKCLSKNVNGKNSCGKNQKAKVSIKEIQMKYQPKVTKPKKVEHHKSLATPKPRKPRFLLRWSPTGRLFDQQGKLAYSNNSETQYDCSYGNLKLLINFVWKFMGTVRFGNDHVAAIMGFGDLQWGNILITKVYFVEGLGHNLFLVGQLCDSDLEVAFRRNACFVRNLEGVDLLKGDQAARTMLIFSRAPLFLWAEAIATACFTQNRSIIHRRFNKTPYELINGRKPNISFLHVFGALCYPKNDHEDIGKLGAKGDIGFFIGYSADSCAYRIYNRRTKKIMETMNVSFDELFAMAFKQRSSKPRLNNLLFKVMYDDYIGGQPSATARSVPPAQEPQVHQSSAASTTIADTTLILTNSSSLATNIPISSQDVNELNPNAMVDGNTFVNPFANSSTSATASSSH
nr:retrovirus-related Pol polyprotein from transposon TNT 1-94 [Tanacetum cinerariifolium]